MPDNVVYTRIYNEEIYDRKKPGGLIVIQSIEKQRASYDIEEIKADSISHRCKNNEKKKNKIIILSPIIAPFLHTVYDNVVVI